MELDLILAATKDRNIAFALCVLFVVNLIFTGRSRIDSWAEANPHAAAVMKALRGIGLDPWHLLASVSLLFKGRLPKSVSPSVAMSEADTDRVHVVIPPKDGES